MFGRHAGVCKHPDCLLDVVYRGFCHVHAGDIPCEHCNRDEWEHHALEYSGGVLRLCPTAVYAPSK